MQITAASYLATSTSSEAATKKADEAFEALFSAEEDPAAQLKEIAGGGMEGYMKWKVDQLKKELAEKALAARGLSKDDVAAMPEKQRVALENQIINEVAEKLKEAMTQQVKNDSRRELGFGDLMDSNLGTTPSRVNFLA